MKRKGKKFSAEFMDREYPNYIDREPYEAEIENDRYAEYRGEVEQF